MEKLEKPEMTIDESKMYEVEITTSRGTIKMDLDPQLAPKSVNNFGGPGYRFEDEPVQGEYRLGAVACANAGPDTNGSQFFICIDDCTSKLTPDYNLFGYVTSGIEVALETQVGDVMNSVKVIEKDRS